LNRRIRNPADELPATAVENGNEGRSGSRLAEIQILSIARERDAVRDCQRIGANLFEEASSNRSCVLPLAANTAAKRLPSELPQFSVLNLRRA